MQFREIYIVICSLFLTGFVFAQNEAIVRDFSADVYNNKVLLSWIMAQGSICNGIDILRSEDAINFEKIGSITGICGSSERDVDYEFTDMFPIKNKKSYYRLDLGGIGFSYIVETEVIDLPQNNYRLSPNPVEDVSILRYDNDAGHEIEVLIYSSNGLLVQQLSSKTDQVKIQADLLDTGVYRFVIMNKETGGAVKGSFVVI